MSFAASEHRKIIVCGCSTRCAAPRSQDCIACIAIHHQKNLGGIQKEVFPPLPLRRRQRLSHIVQTSGTLTLAGEGQVLSHVDGQEGSKASFHASCRLVSSVLRTLRTFAQHSNRRMNYQPGYRWTDQDRARPSYASQPLCKINVLARMKWNSSREEIGLCICNAGGFPHHLQHTTLFMYSLIYRNFLIAA